MRTLDELLTEARKAQSDYETRKTSAEKAYHEAIEARDKAKAEAQTAAASEDRETYTKACQDEAFANERAKALWNASVSPYFTAEQHNCFVDEVNKSAMATVRPMYKRLWELFDEWIAITEQIQKAAQTAHSIDIALGRSRPVERGGNTFQNYKSVWTMALPYDLVLSPAKQDVIRNRLTWFYNPKKEENSNV